MATRRNAGAWAGLIVFAGCMMLIISMFNIIEGIVALFEDERVVATPERFIVVDLTRWGWTLLLFGLLMLATGIGLLTAQTWARITGIVLVGLHAVWQVASLGAYPVWSLLMIALDVFVLFALTARWSDATPELDPMYEPPVEAPRPMPAEPVRTYGANPVP